MGKNMKLVYTKIGIILGLVLGSIPFSLPGVAMPVKLGLAGGPIVVAPANSP